MAAPQNRARMLARTQSLLKKQFPGAARAHPRNLPVLEALLLGVCVENASLADAQAALERLRASFYDWNELRVSSIDEIKEVLGDAIVESESRAIRIKSILQNAFETHYSFDLDVLKKKPLGQVLKRLKKMEGANDFIRAFAVQTALDKHALPLDSNQLRALERLGITNAETDPAALQASLERLITKSRGIEFCALLRELATRICVDEPRVAECPLNAICPTGQARLTAAAAKAAKATSRSRLRGAAGRTPRATKESATARSSAPKKKKK